MAPGPSFRLSGIEEAILVTQRGGAPWNCVFELDVPSVGPVALRAAWNRALANHELTGYAVREGAHGFEWVPVEGEVDVGPVPVVECPDPSDRDRLREALLDDVIDPTRPPLLRTSLARGPEQDVLVTSISHVLADAIGMLRLLRSVDRELRGEPDPRPRVSLATAREVLADPARPWARLERAVVGLVDFAAERSARRSRIAGSGGGGQGSGVLWRSVPFDRLATRRDELGAASIDVLVLAGVHLAIDRWNAAHGTPARRIGISQAWNLRPEGWWDDVVVNLASLTSVVTTPPDRAGIERVAAAIGPTLEHERRAEGARRFAGTAALSRVVPARIRTDLLAASPEDAFDTCAVSNFGTVEALPGLRATGMTPLETGMGIAYYSIGAETHVAFRYRRERFDDAGAGRFADTVLAAVLGG